jgi:hypothetical protein
VNRDSYIFSFIINYGEFAGDILTEGVDLATISYQNINIGERFVYQLNGTGANIRYNAYTEMFKVDPTTGIIDFVPAEKDYGEHSILVTITDEKGAKDFEYMIINVKRPGEEYKQPGETASEEEIFIKSVLEENKITREQLEAYLQQANMTIKDLQAVYSKQKEKLFK